MSEQILTADAAQAAASPSPQTAPPPPVIEHINNYYIPRDEIVRAIPLGGEPSMGMTAPYKTHQVRAFEVAATYGRQQPAVSNKNRYYNGYSSDNSGGDGDDSDSTSSYTSDSSSYTSDSSSYDSDSSGYSTDSDDDNNYRSRRHHAPACTCTRCGRPCKYCRNRHESSTNTTSADSHRHTKYRRDLHHKRDLKRDHSDQHRSKGDGKIRDDRDGKRDRNAAAGRKDRKHSKRHRDGDHKRHRDHKLSKRGRDAKRDKSAGDSRRRRHHTNEDSRSRSRDVSRNRTDDDLIIVVGRQVTRDQLRKMDPNLRDKLIQAAAARPNAAPQVRDRSASHKKKRSPHSSNRRHRHQEPSHNVKSKDRKVTDQEDEEDTPVQQRDFPPQLTHHYFHHYPELPSHKTNPFTVKTAIPLQRNVDTPAPGVQALHHYPMTERNAMLLKSGYPAQSSQIEQPYDHLRISTFELANEEQQQKAQH